MCLKPRTIKNPSLHIGQEGGRLYITVPCGKCAECIKQKELEWQHRAYAVYESTRVRGGFTFFETLTYDSDHVPYYHGMMCFNPDHISQFRKLLRTRITRYVNEHGVQIFKDQYETGLKVIITSEYGGLTHRPHYHCLFHVNMFGMTPELFESFIRSTWKYGMIDNESGARNKVANSTGVLSYVTKYVFKDDDFVHQIEDQMERDRKELSAYRFNKIYSKDALRKIFPFHRQSNHYGEEIIKQQNYNKLFEEGKIFMPDKNLVVSAIPPPTYIQRKLWYNLVEDHENLDDEGKPRKRWILNQEGIRFKMHHLQDSIDNFSATVSENVSQMNNGNYVQLLNPLGFTDIRQYILALLDGRTLKDYARYILIYRNRITTLNKPDDQFFYYYQLVSPSFTPVCHGNPLTNYVGVTLIDENTFEDFVGFDFLSLIFDLHTSSMNDLKNNAYFSIRRDRSRLKLLTEAHLLRKCQHNINHLIHSKKRKTS